MGTTAFSADVLAEILEFEDVVAVYTNPDAVSGRGRNSLPSPVKKLAESLSIPVYTPESIRTDDAAMLLAGLEPDVVVVAAYGKIVPEAVLEVPRLGVLNVHVSLLPRWRGAAPVERAILAGDDEIGCCLMKMEAGIDTGDFVELARFDAREMTTTDVFCAMADGIGEKIHVLMEKLEDGEVAWTAQDGACATYAEKLGKGELNIRMGDDAPTAHRKTKAATASHASKVSIGGKAVSLISTRPAGPDAPGIGDGDVLFYRKRLWMGMRGGVLEVASLKPDGKNEMDAMAFAAGFPALKDGVKWEEA